MRSGRYGDYEHGAGGAEREENLALRYIRAALGARGYSVTQITFNAEADAEARK